jgi:hypothetical protein
MLQRDKLRRLGIIPIIKEQFLAREEILFRVHAYSVDPVHETDFRVAVGVFAGVVYKAEFT